MSVRFGSPGICHDWLVIRRGNPIPIRDRPFDDGDEEQAGQVSQGDHLGSKRKPTEVHSPKRPINFYDFLCCIIASGVALSVVVV